MSAHARFESAGGTLCGWGGLGGTRGGGAGDRDCAGGAQSLAVLNLSDVSKSIISMLARLFEAPKLISRFSCVAVVAEVEVESRA